MSKEKILISDDTFCNFDVYQPTLSGISLIEMLPKEDKIGFYSFTFCENKMPPKLTSTASVTMIASEHNENGAIIRNITDSLTHPINVLAERGKSPAESSIRSATPASSSCSRDYVTSPASSSRSYVPSPFGSASCSPVPGSPEQNLPLIGYPNVSTREIPSSTRAFHDLNMASKLKPAANIQEGGALTRETSASAFTPVLFSVKKQSIDKPNPVKRTLFKDR